MTEAKLGAPKLGYVIIYVPEVERAVAFYGRAFGLPCRFVHESGTYAELETGATALAFADEAALGHQAVFESNRGDKRAPGAELALVVADVRAAFDRAVSSGATVVAEPAQKPWGQTVSYVRDLDGFLVELCSAAER